MLPLCRLSSGSSWATADADVRFVLPRLRVAAATAKGALDQFEVHLREVVLPGAEGEGRLGRALFETKMRHTLKSDLSPAEILERANREYVAVRREMIRLAREAWPRFLGDRPRPTAASAGTQEAADSETVRAVLDAIAAEHQAPEAILDFCTDKMPHFAVPRYLRFVDSLPRSHAQRILKQELKAEGIEAEGVWDRETVGYKVRR